MRGLDPRIQAPECGFRRSVARCSFPTYLDTRIKSAYDGCLSSAPASPRFSIIFTVDNAGVDF
jgi:hypothetical protein